MILRKLKFDVCGAPPTQEQIRNASKVGKFAIKKWWIFSAACLAVGLLFIFPIAAFASLCAKSILFLVPMGLCFVGVGWLGFYWAEKCELLPLEREQGHYTKLQTLAEGDDTVKRYLDQVATQGREVTRAEYNEILCWVASQPMREQIELEREAYSKFRK